MNFFQPSHLIILVLVIAVLFGSRRLPDAARGLGRSLRIFKSEMQQMKDDVPPSGKRPADTSGEPLEGRVVDESPRQGDSAADTRRDL